MAGKTTRVTPAARNAIAAGLARGATNVETAAAARISVDTLARWLTRAAKADHARRGGRKIAESERPFLLLFDEMREAEDDVEFDALQQITNYLQLGVDLPTAAAAAGVNDRMVEQLHGRATQFLNRYNDGERLDAEATAYLSLFTGFEQAIARQKVVSIAAIQKAAGDDWRAGAWFLERMFPEEYASPNSRRRREAGAPTNVGGRPMGASSAPDRPSTGDEPPPRIRLRQVRAT